MISLVHLVWAPLGPDPLREFLCSYRACRPGVEHELTIVLNGAASHGTGADRSVGMLTREQLHAELGDIEHRLLILDRPVLDLAAYGIAARQLEHRRICFANSWAVALAEDWLARIDNALARSDVGLVGVTASWESQAEWIRGRARYWPYQLLGLRAARSDYPRFPNPHIRTAVFATERDVMSAMGLEAVTGKRDTYLLESGHRSLTRHVLDLGLRAVVVGRDGELYDSERWAGAHTYRSGVQENLLVADRRTRDWEQASLRLRRRLSRDAWGEHFLD